MNIFLVILFGVFIFVGGYLIGWVQAHKYWEHVDNLEDDFDGDKL